MILSLMLAASLLAQQGDVRAQLVARGLPDALAQTVATVAADASARGLPAEPIVNKAIEGFSKRVPPARIEAVVREWSGRLERSRDALVRAGIGAPDGPTIAASAEAMNRGIVPADIVTIIRAAPSGQAAPAGLSVAAALASQGLAREAAVRVVVESFRAGRTMAQVLDLPAAGATLMGQGVAAADVGRRLLEGIGGGVGVQGSGRTGTTVRPPVVPPLN